eukprot:s319_g27.t2
MVFGQWATDIQEDHVTMFMNFVELAAQIEDMQRQILQYQAERLRNVRNAMARTCVENGEQLLRTLFQCWINDTEQSKRRGRGERELDKAQAHFFHVKESRIASSRKIVAQMILDAELAPLVMCFHAWKQFLEEEAKEKEAEQRVKEVERQLKEVMVVRKQRIVKVFETMLRKQNEDMEFEIFQLPLVAAAGKAPPVAWGARPTRPTRRDAARGDRAVGAALLTASRWLKRRCAFRGGARRSQRRVASLDDVKTSSIRARKRPAAPVMSKRTLLRQAPSMEYLEACLAEGLFEEADQVTRDLLLVFAGPDALQRGFLKPEEVSGLSIDELRRVDQLWLALSNGRFGYSVQREALHLAGGPAELKKFMAEIGWLQRAEGHGQELLRYWPRREFDYSLNAPRGHLPLTNLIRGKDLLLSLLQHPAFEAAGEVSRELRPSQNEANEEEVRDWFNKLTGAADAEDEEPDDVKGAPDSRAGSDAPRPVATVATEYEERGPGDVRFRITMITGFETFNARLYRAAARQAVVPGLSICVFTDQDIAERRDVVAKVLQETDVFFCSLIFDFDQAEWLQEACKNIKVRMVFESALELMSCTQVGSFAMSGGGGGMPPQIRSMISALTGQREEDRIAGYTKFLKTGPKLLQFLPQFGPIPDLRRWLQTYAFWSGGGNANIAKMLRYVAREFGDFEVHFDDLSENGEELKDDVPPVIEIPQVGLLHPSLKYAFQPGPFFETPKEYLDWYRSYKPQAFEEGWPVVAVLLYRKHVVSELSYIFQLVNYLEEVHQILPVPIFIQGVDAHIAVRDQLTSAFEKAAVQRGEVPANRTLSPDAIEVDAVVNTIGFPLVGGPAGSMEGGRNSEIAKEILSSLNVPYFVAAPLLIQDLQSWKDQGIGGLQGVVLYALPELDGAIDAVPLGGLSAGGDIDARRCSGEKAMEGSTIPQVVLASPTEIPADIPGDWAHRDLLPDRVDRLAQRLKRWVQLRRTPPEQRKVAIVLYGYPPGIGATGTAALLLEAMKEAGYDVGDLPEDAEELIREITAGDQAAETGVGYGDSEESTKGFAAVEAQKLAEWLPKDSQDGRRWARGELLLGGSSQYEAVEGKWGEGLLSSGIRTMASQLLLGGRRQSNVWLAVQPPLGIPGDPMRLLFERDMTPHPQYELQADVVVHFGMHGTAEWLPGRPLGNMGSCWPDQLLGGLPNVTLGPVHGECRAVVGDGCLKMYLYAANNPSESILAKRRGYGCLVSYNVPPYARAGLYKDWLLSELMERKDNGDQEVATASSYAAAAGATPITQGAPQDGEPTLEIALIQAVLSAGLEKDLPFPKQVQEAITEAEAQSLDLDACAARAARRFDSADFAEYAAKLRGYLAELEASLFSEGLHTLGEKPNTPEMTGYLMGCFEETPGTSKLPEETLAKGASEREVIAECVKAGTDSEELRRSVKEALEIRTLLERNVEEMSGMLRALNGEYVLPAPGGDLIRDGASVLPTGRNIHALDPFRIPSQTALQRGLKAAERTIEQYRADHGGMYPEPLARSSPVYEETIAVNLWGLEAIKTRGESVAVVLGLLGARPVTEGTGRVARYELIPLEELGRPRVDALCSLSGIFRDSFANVVELLDDALQRAAKAQEAPEQNFVRKHYLEPSGWRCREMFKGQRQ